MSEVTRVHAQMPTGRDINRAFLFCQYACNRCEFVGCSPEQVVKAMEWLTSLRRRSGLQKEMYFISVGSGDPTWVECCGTVRACAKSFLGSWDKAWGESIMLDADRVERNFQHLLAQIAPDRMTNRGEN